MIYDPVRTRMLIFGRTVGTSGSELWELSLSGAPVWHPLSPTGPGPSPRQGRHSAIYDPVRDRMIVYGGTDQWAADSTTVWSLPLSGPPVWSALAVSGTPPGRRQGHTAIYDPVRDRMLLFAGEKSVADLFGNDVWALSFSGGPTWSLDTPAGTPPAARVGSSAIYDPVQDRMLVFGGYTTASTNDVWSLSLSGGPVWAQLAPSGTPPPARYFHTAILDPIRRRMVVFAGSGVSTVNDTWELSLDGLMAWNQMSPTGVAPVARYAHGAAYDPVGDRMLVFGGASQAVFYDGPNEVSSLALAGAPAWTEVVPGKQAPAGRWDHASAYDPVRDRFLVLGGGMGYFPQYPVVDAANDAWQNSLPGNEAWSTIAPAGTAPQKRYGHSAIYDPVRDRLVVFAGADGEFQDTWSLSLAGPETWEPIAVTGGTSPRYDHAAIYDPIRDRMVVFGGQSQHTNTPLRALAALSLGASPTWTPYFPAVQPSSRRGLTAIYDPPRDRMIVFGGRNNSTWSNEVWALALVDMTWTLLTPGGTPPAPRAGHSAIYDPIRDRMVVFGGSGLNAAFADTWALSLAGAPAWSQLNPDATPPAPRSEHSAFYDPVRDRMVVFGGLDLSASPFQDTWALTWELPWGFHRPPASPSSPASASRRTPRAAPCASRSSWTRQSRRRPWPSSA
jgi:hypothetical protein